MKVFKKHVYQLIQDFITDPVRKAGSIRSLLREACWACTYQGTTQIELAVGRRPPYIVTLENANPAQLSEKPLEADEIVSELYRGETS